MVCHPTKYEAALHRAAVVSDGRRARLPVAVGFDTRQPKLGMLSVEEGEPFRFNFQDHSAPSTRPPELQEAQQDTGTQVTGTHETPEIQELFCETPGRQGGAACQEELEQLSICDDLTVWKGHITSNEASQLLGREQVADSDLIAGAYEGGFKLWEGALDLAQYLAREWQVRGGPLVLSQDAAPSLTGKLVLELGCGHGIPGVLALLANAQVHFQDYNAEVLTALTCLNVRANAALLPQQRPQPAVRYFAGDWSALAPFLERQQLARQYDVIVTSETIYNSRSATLLYQCIKECLKRSAVSVAFVAAKSYYFGVGGGTSAFAQLVKTDGVMDVAVVAERDDGSSNKREVLRLQFCSSTDVC